MVRHIFLYPYPSPIVSYMFNVILCLVKYHNLFLQQLAGQKHLFTFDKVFNHDASQHDVFTEISQLVQSALDGYKVFRHCLLLIHNVMHILVFDILQKII